MGNAQDKCDILSSWVQHLIFCKAGCKVLPASWRWLVKLFLAHLFPQIIEHVLFRGGGGGCSRKGVTHSVPNITRNLPGKWHELDEDYTVSKRALVTLTVVCLKNKTNKKTFVVLSFKYKLSLRIPAECCIVTVSVSPFPDHEIGWEKEFLLSVTICVAYGDMIINLK